MYSNSIIYQVDAFADTLFRGNPAGVVVLKNNISEELMQNIAMEMNLSETAFLLKKGNYFAIRYFTPSIEVPLCGHATLASAHILYELSLVDINENIQFKAKEGDLFIENDNGSIVMEFPEYNNKPLKIPDNFKNLLGFQPEKMFSSENDWVIAFANSQREIEECQPNFEELKKHGLGQLIITAEGKEKNVDFVVRCFVPEVGINEDPVTGSAQCALVPLWANILGETEMISHQISRRGGQLFVSSNKSVVKIKGKAITVFKALLKKELT